MCENKKIEKCIAPISFLLANGKLVDYVNNKQHMNQIKMFCNYSKYSYNQQNF